MEKTIISGVTLSKDEAKITLTNLPDKPGIAASIFAPLSAAGISVDMIVQNASTDGRSADMTFSLARKDMDMAVKLIQAEDIFKDTRILADKTVAKVSVVGIGIRSYPGVAQKMFETLANEGVNLMTIATSEVRISVLINETQGENAVKALHKAYGLEKLAQTL